MLVREIRRCFAVTVMVHGTADGDRGGNVVENVPSAAATALAICGVWPLVASSIFTAAAGGAHPHRACSHTSVVSLIRQADSASPRCGGSSD